MASGLPHGAGCFTLVATQAATRANLDIEKNGLVMGSQSKTLVPLAQELEKLVVLKQAGQLSEEEFTAAKNKLLRA